MILAESDFLDAALLVVDDQATNVELIEQMLRDDGYRRVTSTMDPRAVCGLHRAHRFDLILLDLQMPGMDGFEVMEALRADVHDAYLPVLVITAQPDHKMRALKAGAKDFISKPFDLLEARTRIRNLLEVRLLYGKLEHYSKALERTVLERTAELRDSEARYRALTELASDLYWEQDEHGRFTRVSGPVQDLLGSPGDAAAGRIAVAPGTQWVAAERERLQGIIADRQPFLEFVCTRRNADGSQRRFQVSGEPMFNRTGRYVGYRGIGVELPGQA